MQLLPGVGPVLAHRALEAMAGQANPFRTLANIPVPPRAGDSWAQFVDAVREIGGGNAGWPAEMGYARR
jgi:DNA helicase-2/ATP-dependent DNA helicase PcrA